MFWQKWWFWVVILVFSVPILGDQLKEVVAAWKGESKRIKELREEIVELKHELAQARAREKAFKIQKDLEKEEKEELRRTSSGQEVLVLGFCDLVGFTEFLTALGDERAKELLDEYNGLVRETLKDFDGREIKQLGDGFLFCFSSARQSLRASFTIRDGVKRLDSERDLSLKIGLHAGEVIKESGDLIGGAVNLAERIMSEAGEDQVVVSETFVELLGTGSRFEFTGLGKKHLKGFSEPREVYSVEPVET